MLVTLFTIAKNWLNLIVQKIYELKICIIKTMEYYSTLKKKDA